MTEARQMDDSRISTLHGVLEKYWPTLSKLQMFFFKAGYALFKDLIGQSSSYHQLKEKNGWLMAGGIKPENVTEALSILKPDGVDVGSGICGSDGIKKDNLRISSFMKSVNSVQYLS
ncbi:hypothetical protein L2E82_51679 [Cichorium intybus]|nr:hypothetical protein L2E82_51679 [Cichorium intybus]